jgi:hypothetical protein
MAKIAMVGAACFVTARYFQDYHVKEDETGMICIMQEKMGNV